MGDLLRAQQDVGVVDDGLQAGRIRHHVRRHVAVVELEAFDEVDVHARLGGLLDRHDAAVAHRVQRLGDHRADHVVVVRRDCRDSRIVRFARDRVRDRAQVLDEPADGQIDPALDQDRVAAGRDRRHSLADDALRDHGCGRGAVADDVIGLDRSLFHKLRAHVLELVLQVDLARDRDSVIGDHRRAGDLLEDHVAPLGAQGGLDRLGELIDAGLQQVSGCGAEAKFLGHIAPPEVGRPVPGSRGRSVTRAGRG